MSETDDPARRLVVSLALVVVGTVGAYRGAYEVLAQTRIARRVIPRPTGRPFEGDGLYRPGAELPETWRPGMDADIHMMVFGDSLAAGLGADSAAELPGVLLARGLAEESGLTVRLSVKAIVGATSKGLAGQVEAMQIAQGDPDISLILIGGNDITSRTIGRRRVGRCGPRRARVVPGGGGYVPDLGPTSAMVGRPCTAGARRRRGGQVRRAGGVPVSLARRWRLSSTGVVSLFSPAVSSQLAGYESRGSAAHAALRCGTGAGR